MSHISLRNLYYNPDQKSTLEGEAQWKN
jgi:hypothetical protein